MVQQASPAIAPATPKKEEAIAPTISDLNDPLPIFVSELIDQQ
jgi:hypothetical protein